MKRKLIYGLVLSLVLVVVYSFTLVKPVHKAHAKAKSKKQFACATAISSVTGVYTGPYTIQITWTYTGTPPAYYTYGGNFYCLSGSSASFGTTTTTSTTATITIPSSSMCLNNGAYGGINGRIVPYCNDGTPGTDKVFSVHQ